MPLPTTFAGLLADGYVHKGSNKCKGCPATVQWFITKKNALMPFSLITGTLTQYEPHWNSCPARDRFKKAKNAPKTKTLFDS